MGVAVGVHHPTTVYSALPTPATGPPSSAPRKERTEGSGLQGAGKTLPPSPEGCRALVYLLQPLGQCGPAEP